MTLFDELLEQADSNVDHDGWTPETETALWQTALRRSNTHRARVAGAIRRPSSVAAVAEWALQHRDADIAAELLCSNSDELRDVDALLELCDGQLHVVASETVNSQVAAVVARRAIDDRRMDVVAVTATNTALNDPDVLADALRFAVSEANDQVLVGYLASLNTRGAALTTDVAARLDGATLTALWPQASRRSSADWIVEHYSRHLTEHVAGGGDTPDAALLAELADTITERCLHGSGAARAASALVDIVGDDAAGPLTDAVAQHSNPSAATRSRWAETLGTSTDPDEIAAIAEIAVRSDDHVTLAAIAAANPHTYRQTLDRFADLGDRTDVTRTAELIDDAAAAVRWFSSCARSRNNSLPITTTAFACSRAEFIAAFRTSGMLDEHPVGTPIRSMFGYPRLLAEADLDPAVLAEVPVGELAGRDCPTLWASIAELCGSDAALDIADTLLSDADDTTPLGDIISAARCAAEHEPAA